MFHWKLGKSKPRNHEDRPGGMEPSIILLHYTGMETMQAAKDRLSDPESKVSAHYLIDEDGSVFALVPEDKRAWHAGVSYWSGEKDINSASIGIELVNPGHEFGYRPFPMEQMQKLVELCRDIMSRHNIRNVLGHSDVAPERKQDPGELFEWKWLAEKGVGLWPDPTEGELEKAQSIGCNDFEIEKLLVTFGYNPMAAYIDVLTAFHRHYYPKTFIVETENLARIQTTARLLSLIRQKNEQDRAETG